MCNLLIQIRTKVISKKTKVDKGQRYRERAKEKERDYELGNSTANFIIFIYFWKTRQKNICS